MSEECGGDAKMDDFFIFFFLNFLFEESRLILKLELDILLFLEGDGRIEHKRCMFAVNKKSERL